MSLTYTQLRREDEPAGDEKPAPVVVPAGPSATGISVKPSQAVGKKRKGTRKGGKSNVATVSPKPSRDQAELERLRIRERTLADDAHSTTALLQAAKQEIDSLRKSLAAAAVLPAADPLATPTQPVPTPVPAPITADLVATRDEVDQLRRALDLTRGELATERQAHQKRGMELLETVRRTSVDLHTATHALNQLKAERDARQQAEAERGAAALAREQKLAERIRELDRMAVHPGWFLRLDDGKILGPATEAELTAWAAQCRIGPTHALSRDKLTWLPALDVPALGLEWMVTLADGTPYGPLNIQAIPHLIADGSVSGEAAIKSIRTGYSCVARDAGVPDMLALRQEIERLKQELETTRSARDAAIARAAPPTPPKSVREQILKRAGRG